MKLTRRFLIVSLLTSLFGGGEATAQTPAPSPAANVSRAVFAGGCFWCLEADYEKLPGVVAAISGYAGGKTKNPTYEEVSAGRTGHTEVVEVQYDPAKVSYRELVEFFWRHVDPTVKDRQFCDHGSQYRTAIYYGTNEEKAAVEASRAALEASGALKGAKIYTEIGPLDVFYPAEEYHQDYYKKNPIRYRYYRSGCGRDARLKEIWGEGG